MGTMIQKFGVGEADNNNERLNLTRPEAIKKIHKEYIAAGADIIESNTFSANTISQKEYEKRQKDKAEARKKYAEEWKKAHKDNK